MRSFKITIVVASVMLTTLFVMYQEAFAFPTFSRRYSTSCITCHVLPPKLNAFGVAFRNNGYRIPGGDEDFVKQPDVQMGAPAWKEVWPQGVWPGAIPDRIPLSAHLNFVADIAPNEPVKVNFLFPEDFELLAAGTLGETFSYLAELEFEFEGETEVAFERGFLGMNNLLNTHLLNFKVGRFEHSADPFSRVTRKMTDKHYLNADYRAVSGGFQLRRFQQGIEMWGAQNGPGGSGGFEYALGVVNGSAGDPDDNSQKDFFASADYKIGGMGVLGSTDTLDTLPSEDGYVDNSFHIGAFGYIGRLGDGPLNEIRYDRVGARFDMWIDRLNVFGTYVHGRERVLADPGMQEVNTNAFSLEGNVMIFPWVMGIFRYEQAMGMGDFLNTKRIIPAVALMLRANVILNGEADIYPADEHRTFNGEEVESGGSIRLQFLF
jgi:hypothetical protein